MAFIKFKIYNYMKVSQILFFIYIFFIMCCKKNDSRIILGNWYFFENNNYTEIYITDSTFYFYSDMIDGFFGPQKYFIKKDSIIFYSILEGHFTREIHLPKIKIISKNQFETENNGYVYIYNRIIGEHFTIDSIKVRNDFNRFLDAFNERKIFHYRQLYGFEYDCEYDCDSVVDSTDFYEEEIDFGLK